MKFPTKYRTIPFSKHNNPRYNIQNKICLAEETEIKISLPDADLLRNRA